MFPSTIHVPETIQNCGVHQAACQLVASCHVRFRPQQRAVLPMSTKPNSAKTLIFLRSHLGAEASRCPVIRWPHPNHVRTESSSSNSNTTGPQCCNRTRDRPGRRSEDG